MYMLGDLNENLLTVNRLEQILNKLNMYQLIKEPARITPRSMAEVSGGRVRERPRLGWMDGVKVALGNKGMTVETGRQCAKNRKEWSALVHM